MCLSLGGPMNASSYSFNDVIVSCNMQHEQSNISYSRLEIGKWLLPEVL